MVKFRVKCVYCGNRTESGLTIPTAENKAERVGYQMIDGKWYCRKCIKLEVVKHDNRKDANSGTLGNKP